MFQFTLSFRQYLPLFVFILFTLLTSLPVGAAPERTSPNVLWIVSDDLGTELSCYGEPAVSTPHVDRLAAEGIRFTRAFSTSPVCSASRTAFVTGMYQTTIGGHHHRTRLMKPLPDDVKTAMDLFRAAGYFTCNMSPAGVKKRPKVDYNFKYKGELFDGVDWSERKAGQPFFAQLQIYEPHRDFHENKDLCREQYLRLPAKYPDHPVARRDWAKYLATIEVMDEHVGAILKRLEKEKLAENTIIFLFGDHGRPHVWGKQWLYDGGIHTPLIIRLPTALRTKQFGQGVDTRLASLIDVLPTSLSLAGIPLPDHLQGIDLSAAELPNREAIYAARDRCGDAPDRIRCVRTDRFKYIRNYFPDTPYLQQSSYKKLQYPVLTLLEVLYSQGRLSPEQSRFFQARPAEELYDFTLDPQEMHNLASDPNYAAELAVLRERLGTWVEQTNDKGRFPESDDPDFLPELLKEKREGYYNRAMKRRGLSPDISPEEYLQWWSEQLGLSAE